jgi:hypothetical protein
MNWGKMQIKNKCAYDKLVPVGELKPNPDNPNTHPKKQIDLLAKIVKEQGWRSPVTVSKRSGLIVTGHARYEVAKILGVKKVPVDFQDFDSDEQEWSHLLADNKIPELAKMADDLTAQILKGLQETEIDLELTGFSQKEVNRIMAQAEGKSDVKPEIEFTEELHESSNYIVLYFDNDIDWLQALTLFELKSVKPLHAKKGFESQGIGRVINGAKAINKMMGIK